MKPILCEILLSALLVIPFPAGAATIRVPMDQPTIQDGIDAAELWDLVLVAPGTYVENIDFHGKLITLQSEAGAELTVIDGGDWYPGRGLLFCCKILRWNRGGGFGWIHTQKWVGI